MTIGWFLYAYTIYCFKCECVFCAQGPTCWNLRKGTLALKSPWEWNTSSPNRRSENVKRVCSHWPVFQLILHNMCVSVSICVCEVSHVGFITPTCKRNRRQLLQTVRCCGVTRKNRHFSLLCVRLGTLTWTAAGSGSAVTVATRRPSSPSQCWTMLPVCSSPSQR